MLHPAGRAFQAIFSFPLLFKKILVKICRYLFVSTGASFRLEFVANLIVRFLNLLYFSIYFCLAASHFSLPFVSSFFISFFVRLNLVPIIARCRIYARRSKKGSNCPLVAGVIENERKAVDAAPVSSPALDSGKVSGILNIRIVSFSRQQKTWMSQ
jgi:hypothetical protein